jgi:DNA excision repair protein ERCC-3
VPAFLDFQVGRLDRQVENYNVFVVDKYTKWMTGVPEFLKDEIDLDDESKFQVSGDVLEYEEDEKDRVESDQDIQKHVSDIEDTKATIKQGHEFELIADLIEEGELPFTPQPVQEEDLREPEIGFELRDYQEDGYQHFLNRGHACFCWMTGAGKSFPAMKALDALRYDPEDAKKAVVVYGKATEQQWSQYFEEFAPRLKEEVEVVTYQSLHKLEGEYILIVYDEAHALPADTFAKGATIPTKYRIGLTASPYREDGRQNYIFALTGEPVGLDWQTTLDLMNKTYHEINIHVVKDRKEKIQRISDILDDRRTLIFCDSLEFGEELSKKTGLTFVSGEDTKQLEKIKDNDQVIVSRIGDHGISLEGLEVVLEADFLYGSRRQQIQRTGRLFHGEGDRHDIFFTKGEFNKYQKRLYSLIEKGFTLNFVDEGRELEVPEKYRSRVNLDLQTEDNSSDSRTQGTIDADDKDKEEFLRDEDIRDEIENLIEQGDASKSASWDVLVSFVEYGASTVDELSKNTGNSSTTVRRVLKPLKNRNPPLVSKDENGYDLNTEAMQQILEAQKKRERVQELRKDLVGE